MRRLMFGLLLLMAAAPVMTADQEAAKGNYRQGNEFFDHDRFADAVAAYNQAVAQDPQDLDIYFNRALADEMVDRQRAIADWRRFAELAANAPDYANQVGQANARIQILTMMPAYPDALLPSHYVSAASDYYFDIAESSESEKWNSFPIKVSIGNVPNGNWAQGTREAFRIWQAMFPLELTAEPEEADIRFVWNESPDAENVAGEEMDWVQFRREGNELTGRKVAIIAVNLSRNWSKDEMRAIVLHEMGHALGIRGHSESKGDIMYYEVQEHPRQMAVPGVIPIRFNWKSLVSKPSQRDLNTLIRLYNTPGIVVRQK